MHLRTALAILGLGLLTACSAERAAVVIPPPQIVDFESYRSAEGFGPVRWGMTLAEATPLLPGSKLEGHTQLVREELVDDRPAKVRYLFLAGHLAKVLVGYTPEAASAAEYVRDDLQRTFGHPVASRFPASSPEQRELQRVGSASQDLAAAAEIASLMVGLFVPHSGGGSGGERWDFSNYKPAPAGQAPAAPGPRFAQRGAAANLDASPCKPGGASMNRQVFDYLGAPLEELAYTQWMSGETQVEWVAHEWRPEMLLTSFGSRVLLGQPLTTDKPQPCAEDAVP